MDSMDSMDKDRYHSYLWMLLDMIDDAVPYHESAPAYCRIDMTTYIPYSTLPTHRHPGYESGGESSLLIADPARILPYVSRSAT